MKKILKKVLKKVHEIHDRLGDIVERFAGELIFSLAVVWAIAVLFAFMPYNFWN